MKEYLDLPIAYGRTAEIYAWQNGQVLKLFYDWFKIGSHPIRAADCADGACQRITGSFDQAALQGLLRRLYSLGLPLISVICLEVK